MGPVTRALLVYAGLLIAFRIAGKRTLGQITTFDFVLLLIIGEATQQALLGDDFSVTNSLLVILTLITAELVLSRFKQWSPRLDRVLESEPLVLVDHGRPLTHLMKKAQVAEDEILEAARKDRGLERLDQIKYAVLERNGEISIIPADDDR